MRQVIVRKGEIGVEEVPAPVVEPGSVLVRVERSCISVGTEISGIRSSGDPLWKKAVRNPEKVKRVLDVATSEGLGAARALVGGAMASGAATGYSAAGTVLEAGRAAGGFRPGDRVACAGAQSAHHAEIIRVSSNLTTAIPDGLPMADASTVTLGAIALQGIRRAAPTMGETFVVVGLGVLGQLTAQLLRANGCQVIGTDLDEARLRLALDLGMDFALPTDLPSGVDQVERLTNGVGADGVVITAATPTSDVVSNAFKMTRRKGRVVLVGDVGLDLDRSDIYQKELDFLISTSYGPGRYDRTYEEHGLDYPIGYVRWTENRNMGEYLRLLASGAVRIGPLINASFPLEEAPAAYRMLGSGSPRPVMVLLEYPSEPGPVSRRVAAPHVKRSPDGRIGVAVVGAGDFAKGMHLPNILALRDELRLEAVVSRTGANAVDAARRFGATYSTTEYQQILDDDRVDLVVITTRHDMHAELALKALRAGKHVLVEKPLALTRDELADIQGFFSDARNDAAPVLLTGFNRRFSAYGQKLAELTRGRTNPIIVDYRMNAGYIPLDHWVHSEEGGGRNLGEACHIYDLFTFLTGAEALEVQAASIRPRTGYYTATDNFIAIVSFDDGSVATLTYTALGSAGVAKEHMDVFADGRVFQLDDYKRLTVDGASTPIVRSGANEKGQRQEMESLIRAIRGLGEWPIPLWQQVQASEIAFEVQEQIAGTR